MKITIASCLLAAVLAVAAICNAEEMRLKCTTDNSFLTNRCKIQVNAITRVVNGQPSKGHLVSCQSKSFTCLQGKCTNNFDSSAGVKTFSFTMDSYKQFCELLCNQPACTNPGEWK